MIQIKMMLTTYTFCKSAYPGSIPGVASITYPINQHLTNDLDAHGVRVASCASDKSWDSRVASRQYTRVAQL